MRTYGTLYADAARRTITGTLLPWDTEGQTSRGPVKFARGAVKPPADPAAIYLTTEHKPDQRVGQLLTAADDGNALAATFHVADTAAGDELLREVAAGMRTGLSVECSQLQLAGGVITAAQLVGASVVTAAAFPGARVVELTASEWQAADPYETTPPGPGADVTRPVAAPGPAVVHAAAPVYAAPITTQPRQRSMREVLDMLTATHTGHATPEITAALADITRSANTWVSEQQFAAELWSHLNYVRQIVPAISSGTLTDYAITGWRWLVRPTVATWAGDKTAVPSNAATTEAVSVNASRLAGAHDVDRKFRDFGDTAFFDSYYAAMTESYAMLSDAAALADMQAAAQVVTPTAGQPVANVTAVYNKIRAYGPTRMFVGAAIYDAIAAVTVANAPGGLVPLPWVPILEYSPLLAAGDILGVCKPAATFYELPGSPIRAEAVDMTKGGIDPGVFGYYATLVNQPKGIAKATAATEFAESDYDPPPVVVEPTPQPESEPARTTARSK